MPRSSGQASARKEPLKRGTPSTYTTVQETRRTNIARSIHWTRRHLAQVKRSDYADPAQQAAQVERIRRYLNRKRCFKRHVRKGRRHRGTAVTPTVPEAIPIYVLDEGELIHYPATAADIRSVMRLLPKGVLDGLHSIGFCLGAEYQADRSDPFCVPGEPDPLVGRMGDTVWPEIFRGEVLGVYHGESAKIRLCAYVYDQAIPDREVKELCLRLQMLATFVHEVAHHYDMTMRGKWLTDQEKLEIYAERIQYDWVQRCVIPYLEEAYPEQVLELGAWTEFHGGVAIPFSWLAGDPRTTVKGSKGQLIGFRFTAAGAFDNLMEAVSQGEGRVATRILFARELHYAEYYDEALTSLRGVLADQPDHPEALTLHADICVHQEEYDRAETLCEQVLSLDETYVDAWEVLTDLHQKRRDWAELLRIANQAIALYPADGGRSRQVFYQRARALLELGDFTALEKALHEMGRSRGWQAPRVAAALRAVMLLRAERHEEALQVAVAGLQETPRHVWQAELAAVRFEAAHRLGRPGEAGELPAHWIEDLRRRGYEAWMDRLTAEYGLVP